MVFIIFRLINIYMYNGAKVRHLPKSVIFCHPTISLLITSALAALARYLFTLPPIYTSSSFP